jgi:hypothetical protein
MPEMSPTLSSCSTLGTGERFLDADIWPGARESVRLIT